MKGMGIAMFIVAAALAGAVLWRSAHPRAAEEAPPRIAGACVKHQLPEGECPFCHPQRVQELGMCGGHGVPEALCWLCHEELIAAFKAQGDWCPEHDCPESLCKICKGPRADDGHAHHDHAPTATSVEGAAPDALVAWTRRLKAPSPHCTTGAITVTLAGEDVARRAGLEYSEIQRRPVSQSIACSAEIAYDLNRFARVAPRAGGILREIRRDLGQTVRQGEVLAVVESAELAQAKSEYLQATLTADLWERNHARETGLLKDELTTQKAVFEAENELARSRIDLSRARSRLRMLGLEDQAIDELPTSHDVSASLEVIAPIDGAVVERSAVTGEIVDSTRSLFAVADTSRMWAMLDLPSAAALLLSVGQPVRLEVDGLREPLPEARITWISTQVDDRTRTLKARAEVDNASGALRANMFAHAVVRVLDERPLLAVPKTALQWDGCCNIVFVRKSDTQFEPRKVLLGYETRDLVEVREGVTEGEFVVTTGSYLLKTEILKGSIGAGCCPDD